MKRKNSSSGFYACTVYPSPDGKYEIFSSAYTFRWKKLPVRKTPEIMRGILDTCISEGILYAQRNNILPLRIRALRLEEIDFIDIEID